MWHYTQWPAGTCLVFIIKVVTTSQVIMNDAKWQIHKNIYHHPPHKTTMFLSNKEGKIGKATYGSKDQKKDKARYINDS